MTSKKFRLAREEIRPLAPGLGGCIASDRITVDGLKVGYMYRERPANRMDSGWRFLAGDEDDHYLSVTENHSVYDVNTIANYDRSIIPWLDAPIGAAFERNAAGDLEPVIS